MAKIGVINSYEDKMSSSECSSCPSCKVNPTFHSFMYLGTHEGVKLYMSMLARANDTTKESGQKLADFKHHLDTVRGQKWIWILDCGNMEKRHHSSLDYTKGLAKVLASEHETTLMGMWIIRPTVWMRTTIACIKPFFKSNLVSKIHFVEGEALGLYVRLEQMGLKGRPLQWIGSAVSLPPTAPLPPFGP